MSSTRSSRPATRVWRQEALQGAGDVTAVLDRPHPLTADVARPGEQNVERALARRRRPLAEHAPGRRLHRRDRVERLWVSAPITTIAPAPIWVGRRSGSRADTSQSRPGSGIYQVTPAILEPVASDTTSESQTMTGRQKVNESAHPPARGPTGRAGRHRPTPGMLALRKSSAGCWRWPPVGSCGWARVTDVAKRRRQGLVVCRAALPFEGFCDARPGVALAPALSAPAAWRSRMVWV